MTRSTFSFQFLRKLLNWDQLFFFPTEKCSVISCPFTYAKTR